MSLIAAAEDQGLCGAVAIAPGNMDLNRDIQSIEQARDFFNTVYQISAGRIDMAAWLTALTPEDFDRISIIKQAPRLVDKPVLLIGAAYDEATPIATHHKPFAAAMRQAGARKFSDAIIDTDHSFLTKRIALSRLVISWLRSECGF